ncbi:MAG: hypothetical protein K2P58_06560 [Hyphomonadaceae bacterium]|nr:hypothetical protein [Hyphomonadaceae bacterium]
MRRWRVPYPKFGAGSCLPRLPKIAAQLGVDLTRFGERGIVIVGSNGKGSTAAMAAALLERAARPVGLFTSPHMLRLNERFRIDGEDISDDALERHWERVVQATAAASESANMGGFEFLFLVAADWFAASGCAHTVWEAGIGGRLDPVRLIEAKRVALTSLDFEHTDLLGDTLAEIARNKIDAAPPGAALYFGPDAASERASILSYCAERGVNAQCVTPFDGDLPLHGAHQRQNAALALALARATARLDDAEVEAGFAAARWPGRLEALPGEPLVIIDVGHTPQAVAASLAGFQAMRGSGEALLVCGASYDKDVSAIAGSLAPAFETIICVAARHKGAPAAVVAAACAAANPTAEIVLAEDVAAARTLALTRAPSGAILVAGGFFLASEFKAAHLGLNPAALDFF